MTFKRHFSPTTAVLACVFFFAFMVLAIYLLWQMENTPVTGNVKERMMHRKTRAMTEISDGLVRGDLRLVETSAERMSTIGESLNWYLSSSLYENNHEAFRDSTLELIEAVRERDHAAAAESALRLERSCIECHALINREASPTP